MNTIKNEIENSNLACNINEHGRPIWSGVELNTDFNLPLFYEVDMSWSDCGDQQWAIHTNLGSITVLDRLTGFSGYVRDIETGYRDPDGRFWLASSGFDVRDREPKTFGEAVELIKRNANNCFGD